MNIAIIVIVLILLGISIYIIFLQRGKLKAKDIDILREKILKIEVLKIMETDKAVEEKIHEKVKYIQKCSDDELIELGIGMYNRKLRTGEEDSTG